MSDPQLSSPLVDEKTENPKLLAWAGGLLFFLGLAAALLVYFNSDLADKAGMVLNTALLVGMGYPLLLYARALTKLATLEKRLRELERQRHV